MSSIKREMLQNITQQVRYGVSKREARAANGGKSPYIHSVSTRNTYMQQCKEYGEWLRERGLNNATRAQAIDHAQEYLDRFSSASTASTARSAIARGLRCETSDLGTVSDRRARDIKRGRGDPSARQAAIERNHKDLAEIGRSLGARHSELEAICARDFFYRDGELYCHIIGKGGRPRDALVLGEGRQLAEHAIAAASRDDVSIWHVPSHANVHGWRADYAARCYEHGKEIGVQNDKIYHNRLANADYDKGILDYVNENLGHGSNRYDTVTNNYLSYGKSA